MDTSELSRGATLVPVARIGSPLLLKTSLPLPPDAARRCSGRIFLSIAGTYCPEATTQPSGSCSSCRFGRLVRALLYRDKLALK